jgi:PAS domain S-box-containing protein
MPAPAEAEAKYRALLEAAMDAVFLETLAGEIIDCNDAAGRLYGYARGEMIGLHVADLVPDEIARTLPDVITAELAEGGVRVEALGKRKDGSVFPTEVSTRLLGSPEATYAMICVRDVTGPRAAERALRLSEAKYRLLVDSTYDWEMWISPAGKVLYASPASRRITGHAPQVYEADPDLLTRLVHPDDRSAYAAHTLAERSGALGELTFRLVHADGSVHSIHHVCRPLYSAGDEFLGTRISNRDVTEARRTEEQLAAMQSLLLASTEQSPAGIIVIDTPDLVFRTFNSAAAEITGLRPDELPLNMPLRDYSASWQIFRAGSATPCAFSDLPVARAVLKGETLQNESLLVRRHDGSERWVLANAAPVRGSRGEIVAGITVFLDMTERRQASEALRESEERYRRLLESVTNYVYTVEVKDGRPVSTRHGPGCEALTGYTAREYAANPLLWHSMVYDADKPAVTDQAARVLAGEGPLQLEHRIICKNGAIRWVRNTSVPHFDAHRRLVAYEGVLVDITERRLAEETLKESEARYRTLFEQANVAIFLADAAGRILDVNRRACQLLGYARERLLAMHMADLLPPDVRPSTDVPAQPQPFETLYWHSSGRRIPVEITNTRLTAQGGSASMSVVRDISDRKQAEEAQQRARDELEKRVEERTTELHTANWRLRQMTRRVVMTQEDERRHLARELHDEAGQLLTGLKLSLETSRRQPPEQAQEGIRRAVEAVSDLIQRIRNMSLDLRPAVLDDLGLLPALLWHIDRYTAQTGVRVSFEHTGLETRFAPEIETAAYRIVQEALTNVARHSGAKEATVRLWVDQAALNAQIEDHGVGFDPEAVLETMLTGARSFGLAGIRERVLLLEGQLTVESMPGQGARLTAELPLARQADR